MNKLLPKDNLLLEVISFRNTCKGVENTFQDRTDSIKEKPYNYYSYANVNRSVPTLIEYGPHVRTH